ncbi:MAG: class I SAM-dependent methyltransferase [Lachnospiraceae bacterium]|nr:class I SAM-dependent methyltransferase [Lachnospiraceae bacterium]
MLEKMDEFFAARVVGYDEHMKRDIKGAKEFYGYTASLLPKKEGAHILDLGCGTGLELEEYFKLNPEAKITGIDLSESMLAELKKKFADKDVSVICGSYFDEPLGTEKYDSAVSVESLHHFERSLKLDLYKKLHAALKHDGVFVLTDYFAESEALEVEYFENLKNLKIEQGISDGEFYHYDTPLTVEHEMEVLREAGFSDVKIMKNWEATFTVLAGK